jgi:hypothetical protein
LETSGGNLSILGFYAEQMVISSLAIKGHELVVLGPNFQKMGMVGKKKRAQPWKIRTFMRQIPHLSRETGVTMYIPTEYDVTFSGVGAKARPLAEQKQAS